ncbi:hypothetical protein KVG96_12595 [Pseudomonas sp. COR58]|uniref:DUF2975 domain-containing protein n=1 Tax=Pseudomonas ekonensis TaxID=2842353 RepID=A0ABS6PFJ5_9PSED|nr:hypothetical protein [Pseudomonas ekonensis]MBV4458792.1 hypothetical protein [Pseudomonas ekonensis]
MIKARYPRGKVFLAFFLCPMVVGGIAGVIKTVTVFAHLIDTPKLLGEVRGGELLLMPFLAPFLAQLVFCLPFLFFALAIALMRVRKTALNCLLVALAGAGVAAGWMFWFVLLVVRNNDINGGEISDYWLELSVSFLASMASCWLAARTFLPQQDSEDRAPDGQ